MPESTCEIDHLGNKRWFNSDGKLHRLDGPAVEYADGYKAWYRNDKLHRVDGPAIEYPSGRKEFYVRGKRCYTFKEFFDAIPKENREAALLLIAEFENV